MAERVHVVYKDGKEEYLKAKIWFPDGHWVHFINPDAAKPPVKDIHQEMIASIEFVDMPSAELEALEGKSCST